MEARRDHGAWYARHKWSLISLALSVGGYTSIWLTVNHLYQLGVWNRHSALAHQLASVQAGIGVLSVLIAILAIRREADNKLGFVALVCGVLVSGSAAV